MQDEETWGGGEVKVQVRQDYSGGCYVTERQHAGINVATGQLGVRG